MEQPAGLPAARRVESFLLYSNIHYMYSLYRHLYSVSDKWGEAIQLKIEYFWILWAGGLNFLFLVPSKNVLVKQSVQLLNVARRPQTSGQIACDALVYLFICRKSGWKSHESTMEWLLVGSK